MEITEKWKTCLKYNIMGAADVISPTADPFDPDAFYISDGWGTAYGATRLRRLSLGTGQELANVLARNVTRYVYADRDFIYAILSERILKLNRGDLSIQESYKNNVPKYSDYAEFVDEDTLLLMNYYGGTIACFNLQALKSRRKKVDAQYVYYGIIKKDAETFLLFQERAVFQYSPKTNAVKKLTDTEPCIRCALGNSGKIYLLCRDPVQKVSEDGKELPFSSKILVYPSLSQNIYEELELGCIAHYFWLSEEEDLLYTAYNGEFGVYSIAERKLIFRHVFEDGFIYSFFVEAGKILIYNRSEYSLTCYEVTST
ncbi:MAG: hypothetical protein NC420_02590 [Eubacterium sp.]|nr:hypothetical protein [Eubacterium sp.]MCM1216679.1 hypothetical protein [Lachnospiraceae bacterium]MCM1240397.1 hypothetical protein [Lachnospiraceae bacterium]